MEEKTTQQVTDAELIARVQDNTDTDAFSQLIKRHYRSVYHRVYAILGDWAEAEDVVQEIWMRVYLNLHTLNDTKKFAGWLQRIVYASCMMSLRSARPELYQSQARKADNDPLTTLVDSSGATPEAHLLDTERAAVVHRAINELPDKYQLPAKMFHLEGFSYKKIAHLLDVPLGTVQSLINRAKKRLKPALRYYSDDNFIAL